jgi:hypothetical protein
LPPIQDEQKNETEYPIAQMEKERIKQTINRVWGESEPNEGVSQP